MPRLKLPGSRPPALRALAASPRVRLVCAGLLLVVALAGVAALLLRPGGPSGARIALAPALAHAPNGWLEALRPAHGALSRDEEIIRLWESPVTGGSASARAPVVGPMAAAGGALVQAPITGFYTSGPAGPLPIIAADGRTPFDAYRRPFAADARPRVAVVIRGLGMNAQATRTAIETLPPQVTLSFVAYADGLQAWIDLARSHGHEVLLEAPMEPVDYPDNDPGPYTLMSQAPAKQTLQRLEWVLSRASGYFGLTNYLGERFLGSPTASGTFAAALRGRGLAFVDDGLARGRAAGPLRASADRLIDASLTPEAIDAQLQGLEDDARVRGRELAMGAAYPVTLEKVARWAESVEQRGYRLAPASAMTARP